MSNYQQGTQCLHGGYIAKNGEPRNIPIVQSTTFRYESEKTMTTLFQQETAGYTYSRIANPTNDYIAARICELEGGTAALLTSSGQAANFYAIFNIAQCGDHVVCSAALYGGTYHLFAITMRKMGLEFTFVPPNATEEELNAAFRPNTKAVYGETISNPVLHVLDIELYAKVAHQHGVPLIVDNTFPTPLGCRPFQWGADIVTHSTTKYMDGHANAIGGAIVDGGTFNWAQYPEKYPDLTTPDPGYHDVIYTERYGQGGAYIKKATVHLMQDFGSTPAPMNTYLLGVGLETLHLRMPRHWENGLAVATFLENHPKVNWVNFPQLKSSPAYELAQKYLPHGTSGVVSFGVKGGREGATTFMGGLKLVSIATHVADSKTCILHPASTTHNQLNDEQLKEVGVPPDMIRISVGIEDIKDLLADLSQGLDVL